MHPDLKIKRPHLKGQVGNGGLEGAWRGEGVPEDRGQGLHNPKFKGPIAGGDLERDEFLNELVSDVVMPGAGKQVY